jgi:hypothetical protein
LRGAIVELTWPVAIVGTIVSGLVFLLLAAKKRSKSTKKWPKVQVGISALALFTCGYFLRAAPHTLGEYLHPFGEALMVVAVIGVVVEVPHIREFFQEGLSNALTPKIDLEGEWTYEVRNEEDDKITHKGTCTIKQIGDNVDISGWRTHHLPEGTTELKALAGKGIRWNTEFGVISGMTPPQLGFPTLHFVFSIKVESDLIEGYCSIDLPPKENAIITMNGKLYQLAPSKEFGHMHFKRGLREVG